MMSAESAARRVNCVRMSKARGIVGPQRRYGGHSALPETRLRTHDVTGATPYNGVERRAQEVEERAPPPERTTVDAHRPTGLTASARGVVCAGAPTRLPLRTCRSRHERGMRVVPVPSRSW